MRFVRKRTFGGYYLDQANQSPPTNRDEATTRWSSFAHKKQVSSFLFDEQYGLCMYSEIRPDRLGIGTHIEHLQPKSSYPKKTFDYQNLGLSALSSDDLNSIDEKDVFAGHAKQSNYDPANFIPYTRQDCAEYFVYLSNGKVEPSRALDDVERAKAQYTIDLLNLNCSFLVTERRNWIDELDELIDEHINDDQCLHSLASVDLVPTSKKLSQFFTATRQRFKSVAEEVLQNESPELL